MSVDTNQINYALVLQVLREHGPTSRAEITRQTGLSPASVTGITRDLLKQGYVRANGTKSIGRGRPVEILEYDAQSRFALGIELHDQAVFGVVTDLYARPIQTYRIKPVMDGAEAVITAIHQWEQEVLPLMKSKECAAIGIAIPGLVDQTTQIIQFSTEFDLPQIPIVDLLEQKLHRRPMATNRTYAAALAESWLGAAKEAKNLVYIRMGEYLGGALLIDRLPYWGSASSAGSVAHMPVDPNGFPCRCGSRGCLDTVASGSAMARRAREEIKKGRTSSLLERTHQNPNAITGTMVAEEAVSGDPVALEVLQEAARWLGIAVATCINLLGPDMVIFGGLLGRTAGDLLVELVHDVARVYVYGVTAVPFQIKTSQLGQEAVACGAAATALWTNLVRSVNLHVS